MKQRTSRRVRELSSEERVSGARITIGKNPNAFPKKEGEPELKLELHRFPLLPRKGHRGLGLINAALTRTLSVDREGA